MKGTIKIISALLVVLMLVTFVTPVFAVDGIITGVETEVKSKGYDTVQGAANIKKTAGTIIRIIRYVAIIIAVILIAVFGIKFMIGSAEEKAEYKKSFIPLIIGIVVVFGSTYIAQVLFSIAVS